MTHRVRLKIKVRKSTWPVMAACFMTTCAFAARPDGWAQLAYLAGLVGALLWVVSLLVRGAATWRERAAGDLVACVLIVATIPVAVLCGHALRGAVFRHNLERWNEAAKWVTTYNKPNPDRPIQLPPQYSDLAHVVFYTHDETCGSMIDFLWGGAFPVKHTVRRYAINPVWTDAKQCRADWIGIRTLSKNWYELSD